LQRNSAVHYHGLSFIITPREMAKLRKPDWPLHLRTTFPLFVLHVRIGQGVGLRIAGEANGGPNAGYQVGVISHHGK
jgi:hypothetical protein